MLIKRRKNSNQISSSYHYQKIWQVLLRKERKPEPFCAHILFFRCQTTQDICFSTAIDGKITQEVNPTEGGSEELLIKVQMFV
jgi:hypothetical protein